MIALFDIKTYPIKNYRKDKQIGATSDILKTLLVQENYPDNLFNKKIGEGIYSGQLDKKKHPKLRLDVKKILEKISKNVDLVILSEHPGNVISLDLFKEQARNSNQIVIARLGYYQQGNDTYNSVALITPDQEVFIANQIAFSIEDRLKFNNNELKRGDAVNIFNTSFGNIAILNCHDYTNVDILHELIDKDIDIIIVSTFNPASRLYNNYALSDAHRFNCFIVISNIANYGGSGVYGPFHSKGEKEKPLHYGGVLAHIKGNNTAYLEVDIPIGELRRIKNKVTEYSQDVLYTAIAPPQYQNKFKDIPINSIDLGGEEFLTNAGEIKIGVCHLNGLEQEEYVKHFYHIASSGKIENFVLGIQNHLERLSKHLRDCKEKLDFLVFPEVFLPLTMESDLKRFCQEFKTIIIAGIEYDEQKTEITIGNFENACGCNRCLIFVPSDTKEPKSFIYKKMTMSQYDALTPESQEKNHPIHFKFETGTEILRFKHRKVGQFGVLICYDYSHYEILHKINRCNIKSPPELLFIISYNPYGDMYEKCCITDSHRFYQYIIMCNISQFGYSGVYGPIRTHGIRQILMNTGPGSEGISIVTVDIDALRKSRTMLIPDDPAQKRKFMKPPDLLVKEESSEN